MLLWCLLQTLKLEFGKVCHDLIMTDWLRTYSYLFSLCILSSTDREDQSILCTWVAFCWTPACLFVTALWFSLWQWRMSVAVCLPVLYLPCVLPCIFICVHCYICIHAHMYVIIIYSTFRQIWIKLHVFHWHNHYCAIKKCRYLR